MLEPLLDVETMEKVGVKRIKCYDIDGTVKGDVEELMGRITQGCREGGLECHFIECDFLTYIPRNLEEGGGGEDFKVCFCNPPYGLHNSRSLPYDFMDRLLTVHKPDYVVAVLPRRMRGYEHGEYDEEVVEETEEFEGRGGRKVKQPSVVVEFKRKK